MLIQHFFDQETSTLTYIVWDSESKDAVVIDPVLDFDPASGKIEDRSARVIMSFIHQHRLKVHYILETHAHADHLSSSQWLKQKLPGSKVGISEHIKIVQSTFKMIFNLGDSNVQEMGFDFLLSDHESFRAGSLTFTALATPGHTPACMSFLIENAVFTGDALFMPDSGTGRCDFPKGSASDLFDSIKKLYLLPDDTNVFVGHDYQPGGRDIQFQTTIGESKKRNTQLKEETKKEEFIKFREARDKTLKAPRLLFPSLQVNIAAGHLPSPESNGVSYLKLPLKSMLNGGSL
jgi:glyoxylase-like metal-dependent hydrolase (beta-lactamase superfamily II)